jgi:diaminopimelate decarboxylase
MIDMGGGYPSANKLKPMFDLPDGSDRRQDTLYPYAEAILGPLSKAKELFGGEPTLVLEPGRALVDVACQLLCTVVGTKDIPDKGRAVVVDGGVNLVPTAYWYDHGVKPSETNSEAAGDAEPVSIYGPLCMQIDVLRENVIMPPLKIGDPLVISNVGAYCQTQSMQFIQPRPATVLLGDDGPEVIRRRETAKDIFLLDQMPKRLRPDGWSL